MGMFPARFGQPKPPSSKTEKTGIKTMKTVIDAINKELLGSEIKATGNRRICSR
jgi:hypothetical protein